MRRSLFLLLPLMFCVLPAPATDAGGLAADGRVAVAIDVQGTALVRPTGRRRWSPLAARSRLFPGDVLRTDTLGAHAVELALEHGGALLVGPGTTLELGAEGAVRLMRGTLEARGAKDGPVLLRAPGGYEAEVKGTAWLSTADNRTEAHDRAPRWVEGYRASATDEWMGSLVAKIDGRDVPLAVGYHKVGVEIRDQIARTTIEQSFVNSTSSRLEGIFYFPLPADASISGFGMWIGGELVEADIVERERARQIYEDILRRKKDPGLLEWEGGNLFKARVFPIEGHAEKRIRIRYTQVLPREGDSVRYRYALRSELLRAKPLRELAIRVKVVSEAPIEAIGSPTHECRIANTGHEATVEFDATTYRPERDFEVAFNLAPAKPVVLLPHRRGDDGYLLIQLTPPDASESGWTRELTPEGKPLDLLFVADTSGSMDAAARATQRAFLKSMLDLLGEQDTFRLLAVDQAAVWIAQERLPARAATVDRALAGLDARISLGWTDLDNAFEAALAEADAGTTVVYVGDGIGTTGDADPIALADRLRVLGRGSEAVVHAVAPASTYEAPVLEALAEIGGGSVRRIDTPAATASALLGEVARPVLKNLAVRIEGPRTARVYPARLPNLPLGHQQIVLGRFLPSDQPQQARVIVTGTLADKPVRYTSDVLIPAADVGNSFLPRLWARRHLDALLSQGRTPKVQQEIVAFSERFGIMTPYTSFLVLESDEDRERYGVERRVRMRDGERFFAEAGDRAMREVRGKAMRAAGTWRQGLRREMLLEIKALGRNFPVPVPVPTRGAASGPTTGGGVWDGPVANDTIGAGGGAGGSFGGRAGGDRARGRGESESEDRFQLGALREAGAVDAVRPKGGAPAGHREPSDPTPPAASPPSGPALESIEDMDGLAEKRVARKRRSSTRSSFGASKRPRGYYGGGGWAPGRFTRDLPLRLAYPHRTVAPTFATLGFPYLPPAPTAPAATPPAPDFSAEVLGWLRRLWRRPVVSSGTQGFHFKGEAHSLHPSRGTDQRIDRVELWVGDGTWWSERRGVAQQPTATWVHAGKRGALAGAFRLARARDAKPADGDAWTFWLDSLGRTEGLARWRGYTATIEKRAGDVVTLRLTAPTLHRQETWLTIDTKKAVLLEERTIVVYQPTYRGHRRTETRVVFSDHVEVAGVWWPTRIERRDRKDRVVHVQTIGIEVVSPRDVIEVAAQGVAAQADVITIDGPLPKLADAKQAAHDRSDGLADDLVLALHFAGSQQWDTTWQYVERAARHMQERPGENVVRAVFLQRSRRGETLGALVGAMATRIAARGAGPRAAFLSPWLVSLAGSVLGPNERLTLLESLERPWIQPALEGARLRHRAWLAHRLALLSAAGREEDARGVRARLARDWPFDASLQVAYATELWNAGQREAAADHLEDALSRREPWLDAERNQLYTAWTDRLWQRRDFSQLRAALQVWLAHAPAQATPWVRFFALPYLLGDTDVADRTVMDALGVRLTDEASPAAWRRLEAAVGSALGNGWHFHVQRLDERWWKPLTDVALAYARMETDHTRLTQQIYSDWRFRQTRAWRDVRSALRTDLLAPQAIETMSLTRLVAYLGWLPWDRAQVDQAVWRRVVDRVRARYGTADTPRDRQVLGAQVTMLLDRHAEPDEALAFVRSRMEHEQDALQRERLARDLWRRLLQQDYRSAYETEAVALLSELVAPSRTEDARRSHMATAVRQLADRVFTWHQAHHLGPPEARKGLSRAALKALRRDGRTAGRVAVVSTFKGAQLDAPQAARPWLKIERLGYAVEAGLDVAGVVAEADGVLARAWPPDGDPLDRLFRERAAVTLAYACVRRDAEQAWIEQTAALFALGITAQDELLAGNENASPLLDWRYQLFRLLVATDQAEALKSALASWIVPAHVETRWRIALAYVLAETGSLEAAVTQVEAADAIGEISTDAYAALADWYLVLGRNADRERALDRRYDTTPEWQLGNLLQGHLARAMRRGKGVPPDLDPEALRILRVLMSKASHPGNHVRRMRNLYRSTKDHRVLESLADGVVGHSQEGVYSFLGRVDRVTNEVHEEATCDALVERVAHRLEGQLSALDRRGLLLLTALIEQRASLVPETDPGHEDRALAALRRAAKGTWAPGERRLMAQLLGGLRYRVGSAFAKEQIAQLDALLDAESDNGPDRVHVAQSLAGALWHQRRLGEAMDTLLAALDLERVRTGNVWQTNADRPLGQLINWYGERRQYRDAERVLTAEIERRALVSRRQALEYRLFQLYVSAVEHGASTALGTGRGLFDQVRGRLLVVFDTDPVRATQLMGTFCRLHEVAGKSEATTDAPRMLQTWSKAKMPALLRRLPLGAHRLLGTVADTLRRTLGTRAGLALLLDRHDAEPRWLARIDHDTWHQHWQRLARWRHETTGGLGPLEPRLWAVVADGLREHLMYGTWQGGSFWNQGHKWFWREKRRDFAGIGSGVLELRDDDPTIVMRIANFQRGSLGLLEAGVATLRHAHAGGLLDVNGRFTLTDWLVHDKRFEEALPLAQGLVTERPDTLRAWILRTAAEAGLGRRDEALATLAAAEQRFRDESHWSESSAAQLGAASIQHGFSLHGLRLYEEAVELRTAARGWSGGRDSRLAGYYRIVAKGHGQLAHHDKALDAFSTAYVAGGGQKGDRQATSEVLARLLRKQGDVDAWTDAYERRVSATGLDATPFRKAFAHAQMEARAYPKAVAQLLAARELDPLDADVHRELVRAYDALGDAAGAVDALLGAIRMAPQAVDAYADLARRYRDGGNVEAAARALTTMVEITPNEPAGHRRLAQILEQRGERVEAVVQWRQVTRTRPLEPDGFFGLAQALIRLGRPEEARRPLEHLLETEWEARFGDVRARAAAVLGGLK